MKRVGSGLGEKLSGEMEKQERRGRKKRKKKT